MIGSCDAELMCAVGCLTCSACSQKCSATLRCLGCGQASDNPHPALSAHAAMPSATMQYMMLQGAHAYEVAASIRHEQRSSSEHQLPEPAWPVGCPAQFAIKVNITWYCFAGIRDDDRGGHGEGWPLPAGLQLCSIGVAASGLILLACAVSHAAYVKLLQLPQVPSSKASSGASTPRSCRTTSARPAASEHPAAGLC